MILAAGRGQRMRPLSDLLPKPMLSLAGKPLLRWQIDRLVASGVREIIINHAWLGQAIERAFGNGEGFSCRIHYSPEVQALETAGGIANALHYFGDDPFIVVSGDIYTEFNYHTLFKSAQNIQEGKVDAHLILVNNPQFHPGGDMGLQNHLICPDALPRFTYGNIGVFHPRLFSDLPKDEKKALFPWLYTFAQAGRVSGELFDGVWENIGTPEQLTTLDTQLRSNQSSQRLSTEI